MKLIMNVLYSVRRVFTGKEILIFPAVAILTWGMVLTGVDWQWALLSWNYYELQYASIPAVFIGIVVPVAVPFMTIWLGKRSQNEQLLGAGWQMASAIGASLIVSTLFKSITNRLAREPFTDLGAEDFSHEFDFGFLTSGNLWEGIVEGWPSGHTMTAFAMIVALIYSYPKKRWLRAVGIIYAAYIGLGVSLTVHWLSDVIAGAGIGIVIGRIGKSST